MIVYNLRKWAPTSSNYLLPPRAPPPPPDEDLPPLLNPPLLPVPTVLLAGVDVEVDCRVVVDGRVVEVDGLVVVVVAGLVVEELAGLEVLVVVVAGRAVEVDGLAVLLKFELLETPDDGLVVTVFSGREVTEVDGLFVDTEGVVVVPLPGLTAAPVEGRVALFTDPELFETVVDGCLPVVLKEGV